MGSDIPQPSPVPEPQKNPKKPQRRTKLETWLHQGAQFLIEAVFHPDDFLKKHILALKGGSTIVILVIIGGICYHFLKSSLPSRQIQQTVSVSNAIQPSIQQVSGASNVTQNIDHSEKAFQSNYIGLSQGALIQSTIQNLTQIYYPTGSTNPTPDESETKKSLAEIDRKVNAATNDIQLTRKDIAAITATLKELDERTEHIKRLPDGRTSFGGVVAGSSTKLPEEAASAIESLHKQDYSAAYTKSLNIISEFEASSNNIYEYVTILPRWKASIYGLATLSAYNLHSNLLATEWMVKAVAVDPTPLNKSFLVLLLAITAAGDFGTGQTSNAFTHIQKAVSTYETIDPPPTNIIASEQVNALYTMAQAIAALTGKTNEAMAFASKVHQSGLNSK